MNVTCHAPRPPARSGVAGCAAALTLRLRRCGSVASGTPLLFDDPPRPWGEAERFRHRLGIPPATASSAFSATCANRRRESS